MCINSVLGFSSISLSAIVAYFRKESCVMSADNELRYIVCERLCDLGVFKVLCKSSDDLSDKKKRLGVGRGYGVIDDDGRSARII